MYKKILIPLNGSRESEGVFLHVKEEIAPYSEVILLQVIPPEKTRSSGEHELLYAQQEEIGRYEAISYLHDVAGRYGEGSDQWRCEVIAYTHAAEAIADFAIIERVDLIAMYSDRLEGLVARVRENVASGTLGKAPIDVKVFGPHELAAIT